MRLSRPAPRHPFYAEDHYLAREGVRRLLEAQPELELVDACADLPSVTSAIDRYAPEVLLNDIPMPPSGTDEGLPAADYLRKGSARTRRRGAQRVRRPTVRAWRSLSRARRVVAICWRSGSLGRRPARGRGAGVGAPGRRRRRPPGRPDDGCTRASSSSPAPGGRPRRSRERPPRTSTGTTIAVSTVPAGIPRRRNSRRPTIATATPRPRPKTKEPSLHQPQGGPCRRAVCGRTARTVR